MYIEREIEAKLNKWLDSREILAIRGPRQSGKTTLLKRLGEKLIEKHGSEHVHLITLEDDLERTRFESNPRKYIEFYVDGIGKHFFLLDEIQYIKEAGKILKLLFDTHEHLKFIITGSSSLDLNEVGKYLVGRVLFFELYPFSFPEFLRARDKKLHAHYERYKISLKKPHIPELMFLEDLNAALTEYMTYGGYPRIVLESSIEKKKVLLRNLMTTYIEKDVLALYGVKSRDKVISTVKCLAALMGNLFHYEELTNVAGLHYKEAKEMLSILEQTYVIRMIRPFHRNRVTELKKNPKVYFVDAGLRNAILNRFDFSREEHGRLLENFVQGLLTNPFFWRTTAKTEVDFVSDGIPIEVKLKPKVTRSLRSFISTYKPEMAFLLTLDTAEKREIESATLYILPASLIMA